MKCRKCYLKLEKSNKRWGWICTECIKKYRREWGKKRRLAGFSTGGKPSSEWRKNYNREYNLRPGVKEKKSAWVKKYSEKYSKDPKNKLKIIARWAVNNAIKGGKLFKESCSLCGNSKSEAHHPNYLEPLFIIWLCRECHSKEHHKKEQEGLR